jgi:MbtH protein
LVVAVPDTSKIEQFIVVKNNEEQYSIWWVDREVPAGWQEAGKRGSRQECLDYIDQVWTDMRPLSLRRSMDERPDR